MSQEIDHSGDRPASNNVPTDQQVANVLVAVLTYRRPRCLQQILPLLVDQATALSPPAQVIVIDNDPFAGAADTARRWPVRYVHEPRPGIAAARNRALQEAARASALVFIDDDEIPGEQWLATLVTAWRRWGCAAVTGPVVAQFGESPDVWIAASGAFDRRVHRTGDRVPGAATNNLLLDVQAVHRYRLTFDERLGLTGGEDTLFSHQLIHHGGEIRWCDEAEVIEPVSPDRLNRRWVLRRAYRAGSSWSRMELSLAGTWPRRGYRRADLAARGVLKLALGVGLAAAGYLTADVTRQARGTMMSASYAGLLAGAVGLSLREYGRS